MIDTCEINRLHWASITQMEIERAQTQFARRDEQHLKTLKNTKGTVEEEKTRHCPS